MTRSRFLFFAVSTALVLPILAGSLLGAASGKDNLPFGDSLYKYLSVFTETLGLVEQAYVEEADVDTLMNAALDGVTDALDPLAVYVPKAALAGYIAAREVGAAHSGLLVLRERGMVYALAVQPGSPAEAAGIEDGDLISEIDGRSTRVLPLWEIQELLAGKPGTRLPIRAVRYTDTLDLPVTLARFEPPAPAVEEHRGVPVLVLGEIDSEMVPRVRELLAERADAGRLVIDLRGLAGGDMAAAYELASLFAGGDLGQLRRRDETLATFASEGPLWTGEIAVLTDRVSLGAAEVLASVLRQKAGAELVGQRTFGFAGRQTRLDLASGGVLFLADAFYTGPDGEPLREPLEPDIRVEATFSFNESAEEDDAETPDRTLEKALDHLLAPAAEAAAA